MKAYKLFNQRKDGTIGPLFINRKQRVPLGEWLQAESHRTKGYKFRPGWHCTSQPDAPHLSEKGRAWYLVEIDGDIETMNRPKHQGGTWYVSEKIKVIRKL